MARGSGAVLLALLALGHAPARAQLLDLPDAPPYLSTSVPANVMLLMDNSQAMNHIIWAADYDPQATYPDYSPQRCGELDDARCWFPTQAHVQLEADDLAEADDCLAALPLRARCNRMPAPASAMVLAHGPERGDCAPGFREGRLNGTGEPRCLRLPDPAGQGRTRYTGHYLNFLFDTYGVDGESAELPATIPVQTRLQAGKAAATALVSANPDLKFGLAEFNPPTPGDRGPGGSIRAECGIDRPALLGTIDGLTGDTEAPMAETLYEITRYFRGLQPFQGTGDAYTSPIRLRCQKSFVVAITQGLPTYDRTFPGNDPADTSHALPDWDALAPSTTSAQFPNFPTRSDGYGGPEDGGEGQDLYFDDLAGFGYDIDLRGDGLDDSGAPFDDPQFKLQRLRTYTLGIPSTTMMLNDAAHSGHGQNFGARDLDALGHALRAAVSDIAATSATLSAATLNSTALGEGTRLFQARFSSKDWSGDLQATLVSTGQGGPCPAVLQIGRPCEAIAWSAAAQLDARNPDSRSILSYNRESGIGIPFRWSSLPGAQRTLLNIDAHDYPTALTADGRGEQRVAYLRGDRTLEDAISFRERGSRLGDIVDSDPVYVGPPDAALRFAGYAGFRAALGGRTPVVYVGANDGMLHGFDAATGAELLAYVPGALYGKTANPRLARLTAHPYRHLFGVDASPAVADVEVGGTWASYLVGGLGSGGQGLFALDVTQPANFVESNAATLVKWEFTDADDADLGYTYSQPRIVKMRNGRWAAIVGNGYNSREADGARSTTGRAALFIVFVDGPSIGGVWNAGTDYIKLAVGPGDLQNGLATAAPVDLDGDDLVDYIFAGDLQGNLWQFNVSNADAATWAVAYDGNPLFAAGSAQPITSPPEVGFNPLTTDPDDVIVYFGTGKFLEAADNRRAGQSTQSFYGIFADPRGGAGGSPTNTLQSPAATRAELLAQTILAETLTPAGDRVRVTTQAAIDPKSVKGWYIDLASPAGGNLGERHVHRPMLRDGRIVFTTLVPAGDPCDVSGSGWLMELDARSGGRPARPALDITRNLTVDRSDVVQVTINGELDELPVSGIASVNGTLATPAVLSLSPGNEVKYLAGADGKTAVFGEAGSRRAGRVTWRQVLR
ncbi:MAG: pilus assembly protein [Panacagrimonas sp.]